MFFEDVENYSKLLTLNSKICSDNWRRSEFQIVSESDSESLLSFLIELEPKELVLSKVFPLLKERSYVAETS